MANLECPKCHSSKTWVRQEGPDIWQNCLCGLNKLIHTTLEGGFTVTTTPPITRYSLPRAGTKLSRCLGQVYSLGLATTSELAESLNQTGNETSSQLTVLRAKGLIVPVKENRGVQGGSTWEVVSLVKKYLGE